MSEPIWTCPNCHLDNCLDWDWATCLQKCDFCKSQSAVKMTISSIDLKIKVDADQIAKHARDCLTKHADLIGKIKGVS